MTRILGLAKASLLNRRSSAILAVLSIALSVTLLLGIDRVQNGARNSFVNTVSGTDLIVGARTGAVQLLLYSVFRLGEAPNNISYETYQEITQRPEVNWSIPLSLGDSHRGYRVLGTNSAYFEHYRYGDDLALEFDSGERFLSLYQAVLGYEVAQSLSYQVGTQIVLTHGIGEAGITDHENQPFEVVGILKKTGTPVDRTVHVSLHAIEAIHQGWDSGAPSSSNGASSNGAISNKVEGSNLQPKQITAFMLGLKNKFALFSLQRFINTYSHEAIMAVLPGATFLQLWQTISIAQNALSLIAVFVVLSGILGMIAMLLTTLNERRREMAILRSVGARPRHVFFLLSFEAGLLSFMGALLGWAGMYAAILLARPTIYAKLGIWVELTPPGGYDLAVLGSVVAAGTLSGFFPAWRAYRHSLADGLTIRV